MDLQSGDINKTGLLLIPQTVNLLSIFVFSFDGRGHVQPIFRYSGAYSTDATIINYPE